MDKEFTENIRYASMIQSAVLPSAEYLERSLGEYFVLFKPKNVVSGDFYWVKKDKDALMIAVADCTGHGVPGALMSIMGISFLNEITAVGKIQANRILNQLREKVMKAMHQTGEWKETKDGMDISLCIIDQSSNQLEYAAAFNPAYVLREGELIELKADRMPIGVDAIEERSFNSRLFDLQTNDCLYLFSDGYADQFGGKHGKKLKYKTFQELLLKYHDKPMNKQGQKMEHELKKWMGDHQQLDDILLLGMRIA